MRCFVNGILCDKYEEHCGLFRISNPELGANFLKPNGELISNEWYMNANDFHCGFAVIQLAENGCNYLKIDGYLLNKVERLLGIPAWKVQRQDGKWNFATIAGEIICKEWYRDVRELVYSVLQVQKDDGNWYTLNENGEITD